MKHPLHDVIFYEMPKAFIRINTLFLSGWRWRTHKTLWDFLHYVLCSAFHPWPAHRLFFSAIQFRDVFNSAVKARGVEVRLLFPSLAPIPYHLTARKSQAKSRLSNEEPVCRLFHPPLLRVANKNKWSSHQKRHSQFADKFMCWTLTLTETMNTLTSLYRSLNIVTSNYGSDHHFSTDSTAPLIPT